MAEAQSSILIVDDDAEDLSAVEQALAPLNASIVTLRDPHEVLPTVRGLLPDVVVLDALLPGLSGFDLCKEIKTDPDLKTTQVLILTAVYLRQQYRHEALQQFKADAFLTKPFRPPELQRLVGGLLVRKARTPQGSLLGRLGLPVGAKPAKRSLLGRLFGRGEDEEGETRLTPPRPSRRRPEEPDESSGRRAEGEATNAPRPFASEPASEETTVALGGPFALPAALPDRETDLESSGVEPAARAEETGEATPDEGGKARDDVPDAEQRELFNLSAPEPASPMAMAAEAPVGETLAAEDAEPAAEAEPPTETDPGAHDDSTVEVDESPFAAVSAATPAEPAPAAPTVTEREPAEGFESEEPSAVLDETSGADSAAEAMVSVEAALEEPEPSAAGASALEDGVAPVEQAANFDDDEAAEPEPSAAEMLEAAPSDGDGSVRWEPAVEEPASEPSFETSKTRPAVELPESLKSAGLSAASPVSRADAVPEADVPSAPEEPVRNSAPAAEAKSPSGADTERPATLEKRHPPPRRVGEAPVFDEEEFDAELSRELSKCRRVDRPLTLILIQVDDLDQIVELFGREFREEVLWHVADQAMVSLREVDIVGMISSKDRIAMTAFASDRYGGSRIVTRMRRTVGKHPIRVGEELPPIIPELAFGMASYPEDADDVELLISRAEEDLRSAKAHRRD